MKNSCHLSSFENKLIGQMKQINEKEKIIIEN